MMVYVGLLALATTVGAVATFLWMWRDEARTPRLLCLMYHRFVSGEEYRTLRGTERIYSIRVEHFKAHLRWLRDEGYQSVSMAEALAFVRGTGSLPPRSVLLTIDDGCRSVLTRVEPLLSRYGLRATLFVTTDPTAYVFDPARPEQARLADEELCGLDSSVFDVEAHGRTHRPLTQLSNAELAAELEGARQDLGGVLGRPVRYMACPGGWYDDRVLRFAHNAGYEAVCVSDSGAIHVGDDPMRLRRINVAGTVNADRFARLLSPFGLARLRFLKACKQVPGRILGPRLWMPIRRVIRSANVSHGSAVWVVGLLATVAALVVTWVSLQRWHRAP